MKMKNKSNGIKKLLSLLTIIAILIGLVPVSEVKAADATSANAMSSSMINFFKETYAITDVNTLSPEEIRVYAVFISNFMKPGMFTVEDLKGGTDSAFVQQIGHMFFASDGSEVSATTLNTLVQLNTKVYDSIITDLGADGKCNLYPDATTDDLLTGKGLLKHMAITDPKDDTKTKDIDESLSSTIYFGKTDRHVCLDLQVPANRGAFKILAAYSVDFILGVNGVPGMSALYIDGFGNIWGSYDENIAIGDTTVSVTTEKSKLKLVMPACLNPLAFTSFADSSIRGTAAPTQEDLKLPLNNAFAMGAFLNTSSMEETFSENVVPYYNAIDYLQDRQDLSNILNIYGISSPLTSVLNSDSAITKDLNFSDNLKDFFTDKSTTIYNDEGNTSTYIVLANNMDVVKKKLEKTTQNTTKAIKSLDDYINTILDYLYSTTKIDIADVADTLYYFDDSSVDGDAWADEFADLGILGASLFTNEENSFYSTNAKTNGLTTMLSMFYDSISSLELDTSSELENLQNLKEAESQLLSVFTVHSDKKLQVRATKGNGKLVYLLSKLDTSCSNYNDLLADAEKFNNPKDTIDINDVSQSVSALCYLLGLTVGEFDINAPGAINFYKSPVLFEISDTAKEVNLGAIKKASKASTTQIVKSKLFLFIPNIWDDKVFFNSLTANDKYVKNCLEANYLYFDTSDWVYALADYPDTFELANNQVFTTFNVYTLFSSHNIDLGTSMAGDTVTGKIGDKKITYNVNNFVADGTNNWPGIFFGYMVDILQMDLASQAATAKAKTTDPEATDRFDIYSFESSYLPSATINVTGSKLDITASNSESGVSTSDEQTMKSMQEDLVKKIYGIVSDTSNDYRNQWIKSTIDGVLLTIHRNITGSWLSNMYTVSSGSGSTYQGVVGYISTPALKDLAFTSWFMTNYMQVYGFLLLLIAIALVLMVILKLRSWRQGSALFMFMTLALLLPNILLGNTINITNSVTDSIFSDKFDFWAMTQHQQALTNLDNAVSTKEEVIASTFQQAEEMYSSDAGVRIKWMSPKKKTAFDSLYTNANMSDSFATNLTIFKWLFSSFIYESDFVDNDPLATYVYRSYNSIATEGIDYYELGMTNILKVTNGAIGIDGSDSKIANAKTLKFVNKEGEKVKTTVQPYTYVYNVYKAAIKSPRSSEYDKMFYAALLDDSFYTNEDNFADIYYGSDTTAGKINDINLVDTWNPDFNSDSVALWGMGCSEINNVMFTEAEVASAEATVGIDSNLEDEIETVNIATEDANKAAFLMNTESPYYYFYNTLKYRYGEGSDTAFKSALMDNDIFVVRNTDLESTSKSVNNTVRDFLDLEGMFTYMIPYLSVCNDYVYDWTSINGTSIDAYDFTNPVDGEATTADDYVSGQRLKMSMQKVWNMYTPWVDELNSLDTSNQKVTIGTKSIRIQNTLNPSYYLLAGRPMIFSEADMIAKGYKYSDLTDIERRMQKVLDDTYTDLQYLVNYYDMDDEVLLSAAAMYATFNFNKEFSQNSLLGESVNLYPQNFEMKNFNHDAFLRLALLNSTGETVFSDKDLFETVLSKTSVFTGILLLLEDVLAIILIPALKFIVLLMLFFLGCLLCVTFILQPPDKIVEVMAKTIGLPTGLFMIASVIFAYLVSLLIGDGLTSYVGSASLSIATNDPTITILFLIVLNVIYVIIMLNLIKILFESLKSYGLATMFAGVGLVQGFAAKGVSKALSVVNGGVGKAGELVGNAANTVLSATAGGIVGGKDGAKQGLIKGLKGKKALDTLDYELGKKRNDAAMQQSGFGGGRTSTGAFIPKADMKSAIDSKSNSYNDATNNPNSEVTNIKPAKVKQQSSIGGRALSVPIAVGLGAAGGLKIAGQYANKGARGVNVAARVGGHYTKEGAKAVGSGVVAGAKIIGETTKAGVNTAGNYLSNHSAAEMGRDGAKLVGKSVYGAGKVVGRGAIATGKLAAKPVVYTGKAIGNYAVKSGRDAMMLNQPLANSINTKYDALYKENHGYGVDINDKASGKIGTNREIEKADKIKRNFDNTNQGRANREAWEIINKLDANRKG